MASAATTLELQGVVRYTLTSPNEISAKWMSSRMLDRFSEPGIGKAKRIEGQGNADAKEWAGVWEISYFEPDGKLAVTPFILKLERKEKVSLLFLSATSTDGVDIPRQAFHGTWALPNSPEKPILSGFGFEDEDGKLCMRYGS